MNKLEIVLKHKGNVTRAAEELGMSRTSLRCYLAQMKVDEIKATLQGDMPKIGITDNLPEPLKVKGVSIYNPRSETNPKAYWLKADVNKSAMLDGFYDAVNGIVDGLEPYPVSPAPRAVYDHLLTQYTITDLHVGMYAWDKETGGDWDLDICERTISEAMRQLVEGSPDSKTALLLQLGDFLHFDGIKAITPTSGHLLDADGRWEKVFDTGLRIIVRVIDMLLAKHDEVICIMAEGNHDISASAVLRSVIKRLYANNPRFRDESNATGYYAIKHGNTMIGAHHGHKVKVKGFPTIFSNKFPRLWGDTVYRYLHSGHLHSLLITENGGAITYQHPTIAAPDNYGSSYFGSTIRELTAIDYCKRYGRIATRTVTNEMVTDNFNLKNN